jgi:hypothetical protein
MLSRCSTAPKRGTYIMSQAPWTGSNAKVVPKPCFQAAYKRHIPCFVCLFLFCKSLFEKGGKQKKIGALLISFSRILR